MTEFIQENWPALIATVVALVSLWYVRKSALAAVTSASASETSAQTAEDALAEARRQHRAGIRPHLAMEIEEFPKPNVGTYYAVTIRNTGLGAAQNGGADFYVKSRPRIGQGPQPQPGHAKPMVRKIASLDKGGSARIFESSSPLDDVRGTIVCQDVEGNHYWFRRRDWSDGWEWGEGEPPKPEQTDQYA